MKYLGAAKYFSDVYDSEERSAKLKLTDDTLLNMFPGFLNPSDSTTPQRPEKWLLQHRLVMVAILSVVVLSLALAIEYVWVKVHFDNSSINKSINFEQWINAL